MAYNNTKDIFGRLAVLRVAKRSLKLLTNQWPFGITLIALCIFAFFRFFIADLEMKHGCIVLPYSFFACITEYSCSWAAARKEK
ncbi:hypothetical protein A8L44_18365 [Bacillus sp. FJAT-27986]|nr:hypothetical protein A8L44_18365 [Bacillus sp. FJAT-27986]